MCQWDPLTRQEATDSACDEHSTTYHLVHRDVHNWQYFYSFGFKEPGFDEHLSHRGCHFRLVFKFVGEPEGLADTLSGGSTETVGIWFNFSMLLLPEDASDEAVGFHAILLSQGPCHVKIVGSAHATGGWASATFF